MSTNGQLPASALATIPGTTRRVRADLLPQTAAMRAAFERRFDKPLIVTDGYRSLAGQIDVFGRYYTTDYAASAKIDRKIWNGRTWWRRPGFPSAAIPGTSNHGWATALDLGSGVNTSLTTDEHLWMRSNGPRFGWHHPFWAHDPARPHMREPWHFEAVVVPVSNYRTFLAGMGVSIPTLPGLTPIEPEDEMTPDQAADLAAVRRDADTTVRLARTYLDARVSNVLARQIAAEAVQANLVGAVGALARDRGQAFDETKLLDGIRRTVADALAAGVDVNVTVGGKD